MVGPDDTGDYLNSLPIGAVEYLRKVYRGSVELENIPDVDGYEFVDDQNWLVSAMTERIRRSAIRASQTLTMQ
jgi:hypothetical protein